MNKLDTFKMFNENLKNLLLGLDDKFGEETSK